MEEFGTYRVFVGFEGFGLRMVDGLGFGDGGVRHGFSDSILKSSGAQASFGGVEQDPKPP